MYFNSFFSKIYFALKQVETIRYPIVRRMKLSRASCVKEENACGGSIRGEVRFSWEGIFFKGEFSLNLYSKGQTFMGKTVVSRL